MAKYCAIVPCYNPGKHLEKAITDLFEFNPKAIQDAICINDGSVDSTSDVLQKLSTKYPIRIITHIKNKGYGAAQKSGLKLAMKLGYDGAIVFHSDGQMDASKIPRFIEFLEKGFELVSGSRMMSNDFSRGRMPAYKQFGNIMLTAALNIALRTNFKGYHDGYRAYSRDFIRKLDYNWLGDGWTFDTEIFMLALKQKVRWTQFPVPTKYADEKSGVKAIRYGLDLMKHIGRYYLLK